MRPSLDSCLAVSEDLKLVKLIGTSDSEFDRIEDRDFLDRCFERMNDIERRVIEERYIGDKSQREGGGGPRRVPDVYFAYRTPDT